MAYLDNIAVFVRVVELGSLSAAGRDLRLSPAVVSNRIKELEKHLRVRLLNRTTRQLSPTEQGLVFYDGAVKVLDAVRDAEAGVVALAGNPKGVIRVTAPLGLGRRLIATGIPGFHDAYPDIEVRLRLSDHYVDLLKEGIDVAFRLGHIADSSLRLRGILDCERVLCAAPAYLARRGSPRTPDDLIGEAHDCLLLRFPGSQEYYWVLRTAEGERRFDVAGPYDCDDGDVLLDWALAGRGIVMKPRFEVAGHLRSGALVEMLADTPPVPAQLAAVFPHKNLQDPKIRLIIDVMAARCQKLIAAALEPKAR